MAKLTHWEVRSLPDLKIIGKAVSVTMAELQANNPIPAMWEKSFADGTMKTIDSLKDHAIDPSYVGWMGEWDPKTEGFVYLIGMLCAADTPVPPGMEYREQKACQAFVGWVKGQESEIFGSAHTLTEKAMAEQGYKYDDSAGWSMELYQCPRFTEADEDGNRILDYYMPVVLKAGENA